MEVWREFDEGLERIWWRVWWEFDGGNL